MAFKPARASEAKYSDPEALFRDIRSRKVQGLLSHQSELLAAYRDTAYESPNVAIELPTGSGKTLVGLLIAEYRRTSEQARVLYLCPTKQLVKQVCQQSEQKYGIRTTPFVGSSKDYDPKDKTAFQTASTIAVTTYSSLFNTNPYFTPELVILDDAHASENYIGSNWSLLIKRNDEKTKIIYSQMLNIFKEALNNTSYSIFLSEDSDRADHKLVEIIPASYCFSKQNDITVFLDENCTRENELVYPWSMIRGNLLACCIYVSYDAILIRPYIVPSMTHSCFANARQRVFMSATLGLGGDLERITGIREFHRLPIPKGWDRQGLGRRFFLFPSLSLNKEDTNDFLVKSHNSAGRTLVLVPRTSYIENYNKIFSSANIVTAKQIENGKEEFTQRNNVVAILANRYDGIDLLDDECRLLIIQGLPRATSLQEEFLITRMMCSILLHDRIRTRIIQAVGRCTRSATDFSAVIVVGDDFSEWLIAKERRCLFHPELQGELIFGADQSKDVSVNDLLDNLNIFLSHGSDWDKVESDILNARDQSKQADVPGQSLLLSTAKMEVEFAYRLWNGDFSGCSELGQKIAGHLTGESVRGARGLWNYFAASATDLASRSGQNNSGSAAKAKDLYNRASQCLPALTWLRKITQESEAEVSQTALTEECLESNVAEIDRIFDTRGYVNLQKFEKDVAGILNGLQDLNNTERCEESVRLLGELLGFSAGNSKTNAAPDPWWISCRKLCLITELKSDSQPENAVPVKHTRQASLHYKWMTSHVTFDADPEFSTVMITPAREIDQEAAIFADNVGYWYLPEFLTWAERVIGVMRSLCSTYSGPGDAVWCDSVSKTLLREKLDPRAIVQTATSTLLRNVPKRK
jgi:hypothetical protein